MDTKNEFIQLPTGLTKEDYLHFKSFVAFTMFKGRTATSLKAVLLELINQHVIYTNGNSGVRPGARKIRTATNLNEKTVIKALQGLLSRGWVDCLSRGNIEGKASVWRVRFTNPPVEYMRDFNYSEQMHPLALEDDIWTKYALGIRDLQILNTIYASRSETPNGLIKARISEQTGYAHKSLTLSLDTLMQVGLVTKVGKNFRFTQEPCENPRQSANDIRTFYSVEIRRAKRERQHKVDRIRTANFRSFARERNLDLLIFRRTLAKEQRIRSLSDYQYQTTGFGLISDAQKAEEKVTNWNR